MQVDQPPPPPHRTPSHSSGTRPKGILKHTVAPSSASAQANSPPSPPTAQPQGEGASNAQQLAWDEANLSLNDLNRDSTMKITEPKTPFVRYNAETDEVMDLDKIPGFSLGSTSFGHAAGGGSGPTSPSQPHASRRSSEASEKMVRVERSNSDLASSARAHAGSGSSGMQVDGAAAVDGDDSDEEDYDEETIEHRREFAQKRGRHYSNEAAAMKRAQALLAQEDDEDDLTEEQRVAANTEANANGAVGAQRAGMSAVPPVPPMPQGLQRDAL